MTHPNTPAWSQTAPDHLITDYQRGRALLEHPGCTARPPALQHLHALVGLTGLDTPQALLAAVYEQLLFADEASHQRLRTALDGPLARLSARVTPFIRQTVQDLLARAALRSEIDVETEVARPLAIRTLARLLGWPEEHLSIERMAAWSAALADVTTGHRVAQALPLVQHMASAFQALVAAKQVDPADDLTSEVASSAAFHTETERVITLMVVFGAGTSTTISTLVNGLPLLLADQERLAELRADRAAEHSTMSRLVNELLRLVTPTQYVRRWATAETMVHGERLPSGCPMHLALAAMNRDTVCFPDPDCLDWHRPVQPEQAAFGFGSHACPGAPLARLELRVALEALVSMPGLALVAPPEGWSHNPNQRRAQRVRIRVS